MIHSGEGSTDDSFADFLWAVFCDCGYAYWVVMGILAATSAVVWI